MLKLRNRNKNLFHRVLYRTVSWVLIYSLAIVQPLLPLTSIWAGPVVVPDLSTSMGQDAVVGTQDQVNAILQYADTQSQDSSTWEAMVNQGLENVAASWESKAEAEINTLVSSVSTSDNYNTTQNYQDYVRKQLQSQEQAILENWENGTFTVVHQEESLFLASLSSEGNTQFQTNTQSALLYASQTGSKDFNSSLQEYLGFISGQYNNWEGGYSQDFQSGLNQFDQSMTSYQDQYNSYLQALSQVDQTYQNNMQAIQTFENNVRSAIQSTVQTLQTELDPTNANKNPMYFTASCDQKTFACTSTDSLTANGQSLLGFANQLNTQLQDPNSTVSDLANTVETYLVNQKSYIDGQAQQYSNDIDTVRTVSIGQSNFLGNGAQYQDNFDPLGNFTGVSGIDSRLQAWMTAIDNLRNGNKNVSGNTTVINDILNGFGASDGLSIDSLNYVNLQAQGPYSTPPGGSISNTGQNYLQSGDWSFTYKQSGWDCLFGSSYCLPFTVDAPVSTMSLTSADVTIHSANAVHDAGVWNGYKGDLQTKIDNWTNNLIPAIQNWESQVSSYKTQYANWQTTEATLKQDALNTLNHNVDVLQNSRANWIQSIQQSHYQGEEEWANLKNAFQTTTNTLTNAAKSQGLSGGQIDTYLNDHLSDYQNTLRNNIPIFSGAGTNASAYLNQALNQTTAIPTSNSLSSYSAAASKAPDMTDNGMFLTAFQQSLTGVQNVGTLLGFQDNQKTQIQELTLSVLNKLTNATYTDSSGVEHKVYSNVHLDKNGDIVATQMIGGATASLKDGGDATNSDDYNQNQIGENIVIDPSQITFNENNVGDLFSNNVDWQSYSNDISKQVSQAGTNIGNAIQSQSNEINDMAQENAKAYQADVENKISQAQFVANMEQAMLQQGSSFNAKSYLKQQFQKKVKDDVSQALAKASGLPAEAIEQFINAYEGTKAANKAKHMGVAGQIMAPAIGAASAMIGASMEALGSLPMANVIFPKQMAQIRQIGKDAVAFGATTFAAVPILGGMMKDVVTAVGFDPNKVFSLSHQANNLIHDAHLSGGAADIIRTGQYGAEANFGVPDPATSYPNPWNKNTVIKNLRYQAIGNAVASTFNLPPDLTNQMVSKYLDHKAAEKAAKKARVNAALNVVQTAAAVALTICTAGGGSEVLAAQETAEAAEAVSEAAQSASLLSQAGSALAEAGEAIGDAANTVWNTVSDVSNLAQAGSDALNAIGDFASDVFSGDTQALLRTAQISAGIAKGAYNGGTQGAISGIINGAMSVATGGGSRLGLTTNYDPHTHGWGVSLTAGSGAGLNGSISLGQHQDTTFSINDSVGGGVQTGLTFDATSGTYGGNVNYDLGQFGLPKGTMAGIGWKNGEGFTENASIGLGETPTGTPLALNLNAGANGFAGGGFAVAGANAVNFDSHGVGSVNGNYANDRVGMDALANGGSEENNHNGEQPNENNPTPTAEATPGNNSANNEEPTTPPTEEHAPNIDPTVDPAQQVALAPPQEQASAPPEHTSGEVSQPSSDAETGTTPESRAAQEENNQNQASQTIEGAGVVLSSREGEGEQNTTNNESEGNNSNSPSEIPDISYWNESHFSQYSDVVAEGNDIPTEYGGTRSDAGSSSQNTLDPIPNAKGESMGIKGAEFISAGLGQTGYSEIRVTLNDGTVKEFTRDPEKQGGVEVYQSADGQVISRLPNGDLARSYQDARGNEISQVMDSDLSSEKNLYVNGAPVTDGSIVRLDAKTGKMKVVDQSKEMSSIDPANSVAFVNGINNHASDAIESSKLVQTEATNGKDIYLVYNQTDGIEQDVKNAYEIQHNENKTREDLNVEPSQMTVLNLLNQGLTEWHVHSEGAAITTSAMKVYEEKHRRESNAVKFDISTYGGAQSPNTLPSRDLFDRAVFNEINNDPIPSTGYTDINQVQSDATNGYNANYGQSPVLGPLYGAAGAIASIFKNPVERKDQFEANYGATVRHYNPPGVDPHSLSKYVSAMRDWKKGK